MRVIPQGKAAAREASFVRACLLNSRVIDRVVELSFFFLGVSLVTSKKGMRLGKAIVSAYD